jgi:hypothetical protein
MGSCFNCFTSLVSVYKWFEYTILRWISSTWTTCTAAACIWWCLCCNKWLCWIALIIIAIVVTIIWLIVEIVLAVFCAIIAIWCLLVYLICFLGCLGQKGCMDNCINQAPTATSVEISWDYPTTKTGSTTPRGANEPGGEGTTTAPDPFSVPMPASITRACGCFEGKVGIMAAIMLFATYWLVQPAHAFGWSEIQLGLGFVFFGALAGKTFGLLRARILLRRSVQQFGRSLQPG